MVKAFTRTRLLFALAAVLLISGPARSQETSGAAPFDPAQEQAIRDIVRDYLIANPEVLVEALTKYQDQQKLAAQERQREAVKALRSELAEAPGTPVIGNPDGDVVVVEFFDYRCPYCRTAAEGLRQTIKEDGKVRFVMKEFPILGPESVYAARAALAAARQGRYEDYHFALMAGKGEVNRTFVLAVARQVGLDVERLQRDMESEEIDAELRRNEKLAQALSIGGTPAFVIGDELVPGALTLDQLRDRIATVRGKSS